MGVCILFFIVSLATSSIGSLCGVGGGVFIKPILDALGVLSVNTITFLSGCTVLSMSSYNVLSSLKNKQQAINWALTTYLAIGGAIGGLVGKWLYTELKGMFVNPELIGGYQAIALFIVVFLTLLYTLNKTKIKSIQLKNPLILCIIGFILGMTSSFLGIGGGPMNLAVLSFFLSMNTKEAAQNSLYIILISQITSLLLTVFTGGIPQEFYGSNSFGSWFMLVGMMICGIIGGVIGKKINKKISLQTIDRLFILLIYVILGLSVYNALTKFQIL